MDEVLDVKKSIRKRRVTWTSDIYGGRKSNRRKKLGRIKGWMRRIEGEGQEKMELSGRVRSNTKR